MKELWSMVAEREITAKDRSTYRGKCDRSPNRRKNQKPDDGGYVSLNDQHANPCIKISQLVDASGDCVLINSVEFIRPLGQ